MTITYLTITNVNKFYPDKFTGLYFTLAHEKMQGVMHFKQGICHHSSEPAIVYPDGSKFWYYDGLCHNISGPAIEWSDGSKEWLHFGLWHRVDGPAREFSDGRKEYWLNGKEYTFNNYQGAIYSLKFQMKGLT